jgi:hypothetical protein
MKICLCLFLLVTATTFLRAQAPSDSIKTVVLRSVEILDFKDPLEESQFYRLRRRIQKVLPYVRTAVSLYDHILDEKENSKRRQYRKFRKDVEKEMRARFENELKNLTVREGEVLVKLINRETGNNCYEIIRDVKGGFSAAIWQLVAKRYNYNLKASYDPSQEVLIEKAIRSLGPEYNVRNP